MKEHSGNGKSTNNDRDPTLDEHQAAGGHHAPTKVPGDDDPLGQPGAPGETLSPSSRGRGEVTGS
jgi:hypothetical protein